MIRLPATGYRAFEGPNGRWYVALEDREGFHYQQVETMSRAGAERAARRLNLRYPEEGRCDVCGDRDRLSQGMCPSCE